MKPPAFQFYADDFLAGTADMTQQEVGAYILLLSHQWSRGDIPSDPARAALIAKGEVSSHVMAKFPNGKNERLERVREIQEGFRQSCSEAGKRGGGNPLFKKGANNPYLGEPDKGGDKGLIKVGDKGLIKVGDKGLIKVGDKGLIKVGDKGLINSPVSSLQSPVSIDKDNTNDSRPDGSGPAATETVAPAVKKTATAPQTDTDWLNGLKTHAAYQGIDVAREYAKAQVWCENKRRVLTRARFINWLNRTERPMAGRSTMR